MRICRNIGIFVGVQNVTSIDHKELIHDPRKQRFGYSVQAISDLLVLLASLHLVNHTEISKWTEETEVNEKH